MIRDFHPEDIEIISAINDKLSLYELPEEAQIAKTILHKGEIIGAVAGKLVCDLSLVISPDLLLHTRAKILKEVIDYLYPEFKKKNITEVQAFCLTYEMPAALVKHFGFKMLDGIPVGKNL